MSAYHLYPARYESNDNTAEGGCGCLTIRVQQSERPDNGGRDVHGAHQWLVGRLVIALSDGLAGFVYVSVRIGVILVVEAI